jgi:hypothetical protein
MEANTQIRSAFKENRHEFAGWIRLSKTGFIIKHLWKKYINSDFSNSSE